MKSRTQIGVDIGEHSVKFVVVGNSEEKLYTKHVKTYEIPLNLTNKAFGKWLRRSLKDFIAEFELTAVDIIVSVSVASPRLLMRVFETAKLTKKEIKKSINNEIEEQVYMMGTKKPMAEKWSIVGAEETKYTILLALMEKEFIKALKKLKGVKWRFKAIEPVLLSVGRLMKGDAIVLDFGHLNTKIMAYKDGNPYKYQALTIGGDLLAARVAQDFHGLTSSTSVERYEEAMKVIKNKGSLLVRMSDDNTDDERLVEILTEPLVELAGEIKQSIRAWELQDNYVPEKIYYTGSLSQLKFFHSWMEGQLGLELVPLSFKAMDSIFYDEDNIRDIEYMVAAGAALRDQYSYYNSINFRRIRSLNINTKWLAATVVAASLIAHGAAFGVHFKLTGQKEEVQATLNQQQQAINRISTEIETFTSQEREIRRKIKAYEDYRAQKKYYSSFVYELPLYNDDWIEIEYMLIDDTIIEVRGRSTTYSGIAKYAIALRGLGQPKITSIVNPKGDELVIDEQNRVTELADEIVENDEGIEEDVEKQGEQNSGLEGKETVTEVDYEEMTTDDQQFYSFRITLKADPIK